MILAMPNTNPPLVDKESLALVQRLASEQACCDYGLFAGATTTNSITLPALCNSVVGLKMYLNSTFNALHMPQMADWASVIISSFIVS